MKRLVFFVMLVFAVCAVQAQTVNFMMNSMLVGQLKADGSGEWLENSGWTDCEKVLTMHLDKGVILIKNSSGATELEVALEGKKDGTGTWEGYAIFYCRDWNGEDYTLYMGSEEGRVYVYKGNKCWIYKLDFEAGVF